MIEEMIISTELLKQCQFQMLLVFFGLRLDSQERMIKIGFPREDEQSSKGKELHELNGGMLHN